MSGDPAAVGGGLLELYDEALPQVYGYLLSRCGSTPLAEDLTAEAFLAAVAATHRGDTITVPWLIVTARHKLIDHWRAKGREQRSLSLAYDEPIGHDQWETQLDGLLAQQTLEAIAPHHRAVLTLRYLDDLTVPQCAAELGRSRQATEALIVRARAAFRRAYEERGGRDV